MAYRICCSKTKCPRAPSRIFEVMEKNHVPVSSEGEISPMLDKLVWVSTWTSYSQPATFWSPTTAKWIQADEFVRPGYDWLCGCSKQKGLPNFILGYILWELNQEFVSFNIMILEKNTKSVRKETENRNIAQKCTNTKSNALGWLSMCL